MPLDSLDMMEHVIRHFSCLTARSGSGADARNSRLGRRSGPKIQIFATDIDEHAIAQAGTQTRI
jgi:hypothetical protein